METQELQRLEPLVDGLLNSAAARQMLIDHYSSHVDAGGIEQDNTVHTPKGAPNYRNEFQTELDGMGFPQNTRNVTITNGSGIWHYDWNTWYGIDKSHI